MTDSHADSLMDEDPRAMSDMTYAIVEAEGLILQGQDERAQESLRHLADDAEAYVDANCPTTDEVQWFSFPTMFERLAYRRVEKDPRELRQVGEPLDRLYSDLALASVHLGDYDMATEALKSAVRWNPMACDSRLNLADLYKEAGDTDEYLALTYSVFERASDARQLARAFVNFAGWFQDQQKPKTAAAALRAARKLDVQDSAVEAALDQAAGTDRDPDNVTDEEMEELLGQEGLPDGANAEIAICLLMCATDAAADGQRNLATNLTLRARDLVGAPACKALLELIHEADAEDAADGSGGASGGGVSSDDASAATDSGTDGAAAPEEGGAHA